MNNLIASLVIKDGLKFDYPFVESIKSQLPIVDKFIVMVATNSDDGSMTVIQELAKLEPKIFIDNGMEWKDTGDHLHKKILPELGINSGWRLMLEADEILHEASYDWIFKAMQENLSDRYFTRRVNVYRKFSQCYGYNADGLCGSDNVRLSRLENSAIPNQEGFSKIGASDKYIDNILIYHYGLMRKGLVLMNKSKEFMTQYLGFVPEHVQNEINAGMFDVDRLSQNNLQSIPMPHPKVMENWILYHSVDKTRNVEPV